MTYAKAAKSSYPTAWSKGLIEKATAHMIRYIKAPGSWTKEEIIERAGKFKQVTKWSKKDRASYGAAQRIKLLDDPDVVGHFQKGKVINRKWTKEKV